MKIIHLANYFMPEFGYQEYYLAKYHAELGHEVHVICSNRAYTKQREHKVLSSVYNNRVTNVGTVKMEGFFVHRLPSVFEINTQIILRGIFKKLNEIQPDVIFAHGLNRWTTIIVALWKKLYKKNTILIADDHMLFSTYNPLLYRKIWYWIFKKIIHYFLPEINHIIPVSGETKEFLISKFGIPERKMTVIPLGVDCEKFIYSEENRKKIRKSLGIPIDAFVIIYVGKIIPERGCHLIYDISREYLKKYPHVYLIYVGSGIDGQFAQNIKLRASEDGVGNKVLWHNHVPHDQLPAFFSAADVAIWSLQETMGALQASACGLPIILRDSKISKERIAGGNGFACATLEEQKQALGKLINDPNLRQDMGRKGALFMREKFCWRNIAEQFIQIAMSNL